MSRVSSEAATDTVQKIMRTAVVQIMDIARAAARSELIAELSEGAPTTERMLETVGHAMRSAAAPTKPGSKPTGSKARKKGPIQLCPSPGCKERAAPSLRMLCKKHAGTPKTIVAKWREARRKKLESKKAA